MSNTLEGVADSAKQKLSESPEAMEKLESLEASINEWHKAQQEKIAKQVILLTSMNSTMENIVDKFLGDIADEALSYIETLQGTDIPTKTNT